MKKGEKNQKKIDTKSITLLELDKKIDNLKNEDNSSLNKNDSKKDKTKNLKKIIIVLVISLTIIGLLTYVTIIKFSDIKNTFNATTITMKDILDSKETEINDTLKLYVSIKGASIDLTEEENAIITSLQNQCSSEKTTLESSIRKEEQATCNTEKQSLENEISSLKTDVTNLNNNLNDCEEELENYETNSV
jgi:hypothetical protein